MATGVSLADLSWSYGANLLTWDPAMETGWLVQMYHDVNGDSVLSSISAFNFSGTPTGNNVADDLLLASFTSSLSSAKADTLNWGDRKSTRLNSSHV